MKCILCYVTTLFSYIKPLNNYWTSISLSFAVWSVVKEANLLDLLKIHQSVSYNMTAQTLKFVCSLVYVLIVVVNAAPQSKLPPGFIQCRKSDPEMNECLKNAFRKALPHLITGVPSLGLNSIDPLRISKLDIEQGSGPVSINLKFIDLDLTNLKSTTMTLFKYDPVNYHLHFEVAPNTLKMEGHYEVFGKVLILPIVGKGKCKFNIEYSKCVAKVQMKPVVRNGITYLDIDKVSWSFTPTKLQMNLENLFNGDKALGDNMNVFLNENWREVLGELQPAIEHVFGIAFGEIGQQFLKRIPENQIFLE